ncbi:MAG: iron chelate uptake ABC transporter family permease subunit, partial [Campylobacteraceae bacterium]|nr:iron chelate uptake ABC transporter family permease subunit [Campylobacteraceae bacterium]
YYISSDETFGVIFWDLRLPRLIAAALIGASLSISGVVFQAMFQNPLVSPNILGVASGAGFGAVLCILFSFGAFGISLGAFVGGVVAVSLAYLLGHFTNKTQS